MLKSVLLSFVALTLSVGNLLASPLDLLTYYTEDAPP